MEIYKLSEEYLQNKPRGRLLERAKRKRFIAISGADQYGAVRVFELLTGYRHTYHESFLAVDASARQKLKANIISVLEADFEVDLTQKDGFTQARILQVDKIMGHFNAYLDKVLGYPLPSHTESKDKV